MATTISTQDLENARRDIDDIGKAVNENTIVDPRYGADFKSLPMIAAEAQATIGEWEAAIALITQEGGVPALAVSDATGLTQQKINYGMNSLSEMLSIASPANGTTLFVKGLQGGWFEYNAAKSEINDGVMVFNGWSRISMETGIRPEWAGAPHDGVNDDADAIRKCIAYCEAYGAKRIIFTNNGKSYIAATVDANNSAFTIKSTGIMLDFENTSTAIESKVAMGSILYFQSASYRISINNGVFSCNNLANYGINTNPAIYTPQIEIRGLTIMNPVEDGAVIQAFVGDISKLSVNGGKRGLVIKPTAGNIVTSLNIRSCYMLNQTVVGYDISTSCYCALIACAADNMPLAYRLNMRGGAMTGCGAENVAKIAEFTSFRGLSINGLYAQRCGSTDALNPTPYLIEFVTGRDATLSGLYIEQPRNFNYKVGITTPNLGYECLNITDGCVRRAEAYFVTNFAYARPIKFGYDDATQKDLTVNIATTAELRDFINLYLNTYRIDHSLVINLANGDYNLGTIISRIQKLSGSGELVFVGNASDRTLVKLKTEYNRLIIDDCSVKIRFKNLTLSADASNNANERLIVEASQNVWLDNVLVSKNGTNVGYGVHAVNGSVVYITNGTSADSTAFASAIFGADSTSRFVMDRSPTIPSGVNWTPGMYVENSNPITNMGWVFSGGAWKTYGAIT